MTPAFRVARVPAVAGPGSTGRIRVLFFAPTLGQGGADRVMLTLLQQLDRARFAPSLVLLRRTGPWMDELPADVQVFELGSRRLALAVPDLVPLLRREQPDVLFSLQGGSNVVAAIAHALSRSQARLVLSERSPLVRPDRSRGRLAVELPAKWASYRRADVVTSLSHGVARELTRRIRVPAEKIQVIYNPAVDDSVAAQAAMPLDHPWFEAAAAAATPVLLAVGRMVEIKDQATLLEAFARIRAARPVRLVLLGEGPLRAALAAQARALGVEADVDFPGFDKNPFRYMARARLMIHTSKAEGLGSVIIQAMACGTPVVATDCDFGPREVITSGSDGFLVPVGSVAQIADRVLRLLEDEPLANQISAEARRSAQRFSVAAAVAGFEKAISG